MKKDKVTVVTGEGRIAAKGKLSVKQGDKTVDLEAKNIIIATGARARDLPFAKADGKRIWTYRHAMVPPEMPKKLLVIGSGAIRSEEHTSELQSLMRISYAGFCVKKKKLP